MNNYTQDEARAIVQSVLEYIMTKSDRTTQYHQFNGETIQKSIYSVGETTFREIASIWGLKLFDNSKE